MKLISFGYLINTSEGETHLLDASTEEEAKQVVKVAEDSYGYELSDPEYVELLGEETAAYSALTTKTYEPLGYATKAELFEAYDAVPEFSDSHAYSMDGYEGAVVGVTPDGERFIYDFSKMMDIMRGEGMTTEEAYEWYSYNIERSFPYYQPSPIILTILPE